MHSGVLKPVPGIRILNILTQWASRVVLEVFNSVKSGPRQPECLWNHSAYPIVNRPVEKPVKHYGRQRAITADCVQVHTTDRAFRKDVALLVEHAWQKGYKWPGALSDESPQLSNWPWLPKRISKVIPGPMNW